MSDPIDRAGGAGSVPYSLEPHGPAAAPAGGGFREALRAAEAEEAPGAGRELVRDAALRIARGERRIDQVLRQVSHGRTLSNEELIALQATVYRYTQEIELAAKLVDKLTGAVRQTLTSQQ
jgi:hypothetical protein